MKSQCCNPDMRYENPLYMAELAVMADLIAAGRLQLGVDFNLKMLETIVKEVKRRADHQVKVLRRRSWGKGPGVKTPCQAVSSAL